MTRYRLTGGQTYLYPDLSGGPWDDLDRDVDLLRGSPTPRPARRLELVRRYPRSDLGK
ncbi:hypothetical protein ACQP2F_20625 [Actinoplanes sp. CA-030573]|uniref:hypothetical protein n=1 Tax=Actinoplanes sp. CA-030573 TaxID=3239898 RepID=UPI003D8F68F3